MKTKGILVLITTLFVALSGAAFAQAPANDNFANSILLTGASGMSSGDNTGATLETPNERPPLASLTNDNTVWFHWQAPQTGPVTFDLTGTAVDTVMSIYSGNALTTLVLVGENDDGAVDFGSTVTFSATTGTIYRIQVAGLDGTSSGEEGAFPIVWQQINPAGDIQFALSEDSVSEPDGTISIEVNRVGGTVGAVSVTFTTANVTATAGQDYTGFTTATDTLSFADGSNTPQFINVPINDDMDLEAQETFTVTLSSPTGGANLGAITEFTATIVSDDSAPNDDFANAELIVGASGSVPGNDLGATPEGDLENFGFGPVVWYKWVAPSNGAVAFNVAGGASHFVEILRGPGLPALQFVSQGALRQAAAINIVQGTTYYIAVGGGQAFFTLSWQTTTTGVFELSGTRNYIDPLTGLDVPRYVAGESGGAVTITVRRVGALDGTVGVTYSATADTADEFGFGNATAPGDFTPTSANLLFNPGESVKTFTIAILDDGDVENTEDLVVNLSTPTGGAVLGNVSRAQLQLFDDENDPANDDLAAAQMIFGPSGQVFGDNALADPEPGEPAFSDDAAGNTIWYCWVAPLGGATEFSAKVDDGFGPADAIVDVFASGITGLTPVASSTGSPRFTALAGQTYLVRVDGDVFTNVFGATTLSWNIATGGVISFADNQGFSVREGATDVTLPVTVQRVGGIGNGATVDFATSDNSALADIPGTPGDYVGVATTIVFAAGETTKTVNITVHGDMASQGDRFFGISLQNPTGALLDEPTFVAARIEDDDDDPANDLFANAEVLTGPSGMTSGTSVGAGMEGGEPNPAGNQTPTVWYSWTAPGDGVATFDVSGFDTVLAIYAGNAVGSLTLLGENDDFTGLASRVSFTAASGTTYRIQVGGFAGSSGPFSLSYTTDPTGSLISVASTDVQVAENVAGGNLVLTLTRSGSTTGTSTVDFEMFDNSATSPADYTASMGTVTFNPTETTQTIIIPIASDMLVEGDESFAVELSNATGAILSPLDPNNIDVSILDDDDDATPPANDNFASAAVLAGSNPIAAGFSDGATIEMDEPGSPSQSAWYQWTAPAAGVAMVGIGDADHSFNVFTGTALGNLAPVSYVTGTTFVAASGTTYLIQVNATGGSPNFVVSLDFTSAGLLSFASTGLVVNEDGGPATITIVRNNGSAGAISVSFSTAGITAASGGDFTAVNQVVNFADGITSQTVDVPILPDALLEGPETIRLILSDPTGGALILYGPGDIIALTINDAEDNPGNDDFANAVALSGPFGTIFGDNTGASSQPGEPNHAGSNGVASLWYRWTAPATGTVTFDTTGSTVPTALAAYTGMSVGTLTSLASNAGSPATISFPAMAGASYSIAVDCSGSLMGDFTLNWQLVLPGVLSFNPTSYSAGEAAASVVLTVTRAVGADGAVSVHFATADGTATAGEDYTATMGDLDFANGETSRTITVPLLNDTAFEIAESFTVVLSAPTNGSMLGMSTTATVTLTSNDPFTASAVNFAALVNPGGAHDTSGLLTLSESATASFSGKLLLGGKTFAFKGAFDTFGSAIVTIARKGQPTLAIAMQLDDGGQTIAGQVYDGSFTSTFTGEASFYDGKTRLHPQPGTFTLALKPTSVAVGNPQGIGFATMTVGKNGVFKIKGGQLADAAKLSATGFIAENGRTQFYALLYKGQGSLAGVVTFANLAATDATATLQWFKPANLPREKFFVTGITTTSDLVASFFTRPASNTRIDTAFDANNGATDVTLADGNLAAPLAFSGLLDTKNKLSATTPVPLALAGNSKSGLLTGSFTPVGGRKTAFKGVFLQKSDQALGQFFGVSQSGSVTVVPD
ncbi:MAG: Calx-beta domain-containing protein [Chthoniobacteraceae bacterium]